MQHSNDTEMNMRQAALKKVQEDVATLKKQSIYTEANVLVFQKINLAKADLIEREKKLAELQSELRGLRNVKTNQHLELEKQTIIKNFP